jgi:hypothetical protein
VYYTLKSGDTKVCTAVKDQETSIIKWEGRVPNYPGCKVTVDQASCTLETIGEYEDSTVTTNTVYAKGKNPPVSGTRLMVTKVVAPTEDPPPSTDPDDGTVIDIGAGGPPPETNKVAECQYEFTYSKK